MEALNQLSPKLSALLAEAAQFDPLIARSIQEAQDPDAYNTIVGWGRRAAMMLVRFVMSARQVCLLTGILAGNERDGERVVASGN
jgi:hypothetical protein